MERPSHILFARPSPLSRAPLIGLAIGLETAGLLLFAYGLKDHVIKTGPGIIDFVPIKPKDLPRTPPPPLPPEKRIEVVKVPVPTFDFPREQQDRGTTLTASNSSPQTPARLTPPGADRAAVGITATHTTPPYPVIERRLGIEGTVTLRLTIGTEGQVTAAEVVKSAGREALDQAARDWIIGHWRYRPALKDGNPAATQVMASVTYSLKNQP